MCILLLVPIRFEMAMIILILFVAFQNSFAKNVFTSYFEHFPQFSLSSFSSKHLNKAQMSTLLLSTIGLFPQPS